jgi:EmrB/QacA subfamily drug resistance transporter
MKQASKYAIAWTVAFGLFMSVLDSTIVNVALVPIAQSFNTDLSSVQWIITSYLLAQAAVIPVAGYLGLRFGLKNMFILNLFFFTLGSLLCGLAQSEEWLIIFRIFQGLGGGALFPLALSIALQAFPPEERANSSAILGLSGMVAPAFGPTIGGFMIDTFDWRTIFMVNIPFGIIALVLAWRILPNYKTTVTRKGFDVVGLVLSMLGVVSVVYGLALVAATDPATINPQNPRGTIYGWSYLPVWLFLGAGLIILLVFAVYELRFSADPVLDLRLYKDRNFGTASLVLFFISMTSFGSVFMLPVFLQQVRQPTLSALEAGLTLMPQGIASAVAVVLSGRLLYDRLGARTLITLGAILLLIGTWGLTSLKPDTDSVALLPWLILRGLGFGFTFVPASTRATQSITGPALAKASSLFNTTRQIFSSVGTSLVITIFVQQTTYHLNEARSTLPAGVAPGKAQVQQLTAQAGTQAVNDVFMVIVLGVLIMVGLALLMPGRSAKPGVNSAAAELEELAVAPVE